MHNPTSVLEDDTLTPMQPWQTNGSPNLGQKTRSYNNPHTQKKRTCKIADFADHKIKLKEIKKKNKSLNLAWVLKKLWNMKVTIILIVISAFSTVTKGLLKGLEDLEVAWRVETIQSTTLLRTTRILKRVLEIWGSFLSHKLQLKTISYNWCKKKTLKD